MKRQCCARRWIPTVRPAELRSVTVRASTSPPPTGADLKTDHPRPYLMAGTSAQPTLQTPGARCRSRCDAARQEPSRPRCRLDPPRRDRLLQGAIVALVLVGIGLRERRKRTIEGIAVTEVAGNRDRVTRSRVRLRERPAAEFGVDSQRQWVHRLHECRTLGIP